MERLPVFVYGTLRPGGGNFAWALAGRIDGHTPATLAGAAMFAGPGFPFVTDGDATVIGDLVHVETGVYDDVLADLDRLEGFHPHGRHNLYDRVVRPVATAAADTVTAWVYVAGRTERLGRPIVSGDWHTRAVTVGVA